MFVEDMMKKQDKFGMGLVQKIITISKFFLLPIIFMFCRVLEVLTNRIQLQWND